MSATMPTTTRGGAFEVAGTAADPRHQPRSRRPARPSLLPTVVLLVGALYCLLPVAWVVVASTKTRAELFTTFSFAPGLNGGLFDNVRELSAYNDGQFWLWGLNSLLYAAVGAGLSAGVSATAGFALAKYRFVGRQVMFNILLAGVLVPQVALAIPQYLLLARTGLAGSYWSVLLPGVISPFGIYLCRIYAAAAVPDEALEAARIDGAGEFRAFRSIAMPMMVPGLVTVFLLQFVGVWNNFLLPYVMLTDADKFPLTVGLYSLLAQGSDRPALYTLVVTGVVLATLPLLALFLLLQRYWRLDLVSGGLKG